MNNEHMLNTKTPREIALEINQKRRKFKIYEKVYKPFLDNGWKYSGSFKNSVRLTICPDVTAYVVYVMYEKAPSYQKYELAINTLDYYQKCTYDNADELIAFVQQIKYYLNRI